MRMVRDQVLRGRHDPGREFARRYCLDPPGIRRLDRVEVGAIEANNPQQV
ncbi:MAG: hypothetical protein H0W67_09450 [Gemmatimonadales bacterium]|nr:hypothetical protein [Gemmatimonadales bacterium]